MKRALVLIGLAALVACVAPTNQQPPSNVAAGKRAVLGRLEVQFGDGASVRPQAVIGDSAVSFDVANRVSTSLDDAVNGFRYISVRFPVTNTSASTIDNLTLYAYTQSGSSVSGTAVKNITSFGGQDVSSGVLEVKPTHGTTTSAGSVVVNSAAADFQVFTPAEANAATADARTAGFIGAADRALEYGFVARNAMGGRGFAPNGTGTITLAVRVPRGDIGTPYRFTMTFIVANETATRVTRGPYPQETTADAQTRATNIADRTLVNKDVMLVGSDSDTVSGANLTGLRRANALISTQPGVLLGSCAAGSSAPTLTVSSGQARLGLGASPSALSGVIGDTTDAAFNPGAGFDLSDADTQGGCLRFNATSSNQAVVPDANLGFDAVSGDAARRLKVTPVGVGFATITVTASDGVNAGTYTINYAASAASNSAATRWHTGSSDASTAVAVDANTMLVGDDENQALRLYDRALSGAPYNSFDFTSSLGLTQVDGGTGLLREVDLEASTRSGNRIYWLGSHSNAANGNARPNRSRLFATDLSGTGSSATLSYVGRYDGLKTDLIAWDQNNTHGLGANYFGFAASTTAGLPPESASGDGFNIEGVSFAPSSTTTAYVAFRAPIVPASSRTKALIVPVTNFSSLVSGNPTTGPATFGAPIQLELGGRGIRELKCNDQGCLIIAGPADSATGVAPKDFRLYTWTGNAGDPAVLRAADLTALNTGGSFESIVDLPTGALSTWGTQEVQLVSDNGDTVFYNNAVAAKDLAQNAWKKSRSDRVVIGATVVTPDFSLSATTPAPAPRASVGGSPTSMVTITPQNGFSGNVALGATGLPTGVTASFSPNPATSSSTLTLTVASSVAAGSYPLTIQGVSGALTRTTNATLTVNAAPDNVPFLAAFTAGNLVVYRVGNGSAALSSAATAAFLDEYTPSGTLVQSKPVPTTTSGAQRGLTNSGSATSEGQMTLSSNGKCLLFTGYEAPVGTASVTSAANINRVVGVVFNGSTQAFINTTTGFSDGYSGNNIRSATSDNCDNLWTSGTGTGGGVRYTTLGGSSSTQVSTTVANTRNVGIFGGQLYVSSSSLTFRLATVGTGLPTTSGQTITNLPGFPTTGSPYAFFFADLSSSVAGLDTLYVADDAAGLQKYSLVGGTWTFNNTVTVTGNNLRGLTGTVNGSSVTLYGTGGTNQTNLVKLTDSSAYNANNDGSFTTIATAATNTAFRGVAFAPQP
jgi:hypothetical protein